MTDVIILAGGRGRRMGALTKYRQKAVLKVAGVPILERIIQDLLTIRGVRTLWVATGYREQDVFSLLHARFPEEMVSTKIRVVSGACVVGELQLLKHVADHRAFPDGCILTGVDTWLPPRVFHMFLARAREDPHVAVIFALSPKVGIATTHCMVQVDGDRIVGHQRRTVHTGGAQWYVDTGTRFISAQALESVRRVELLSGLELDDVLSEIVRDMPCSGLVFDEEWHHFASPRDLSVPKRKSK